MDDLKFGKRNKRGDWAPREPLATAPLFVFPPRPVDFVKWLPSYFLPWNVLYMALAALIWLFLTPSEDTLKTLAPDWIVYLLARNSLIVALIYGFLELRLYVKRSQGPHFKYNGQFPADKPSDVFMFKKQNVDNIIRTFTSGVPIWTAYEVLGLWCYANHIGPWTTFARHPFWLAFVGLAFPVWHEFHFYCIHRMIHWPPLYKHVHSVHHNSINPSPWSSLSMHPVEHLLYWSDSLIHLLLPSHPLLFLYGLQVTGTGAVVGHVGFDRIEVGAERGVPTHAYAHYLHHKYFEVNYADGTTAIDKFFGTWHDGGAEGQALMDARYAAKVARVNQK
jgi:sterol desaturase/sphingolipid hydroxylase (fatty acid hydroxylase superfamily)